MADEKQAKTFAEPERTGGWDEKVYYIPLDEWLRTTPQLPGICPMCGSSIEKREQTPAATVAAR